MKKGEIVFFGVCVAFFGFMLAGALDLAGRGRSGELGSAFWPLLSLGAALLLSLVLLGQSLAKARRETVPADPEQTAEDAAEVKRRRLTVSLCVLSFFLYLAAIPWIGFVLGTFLFVPGFALALGERRPLVLIVSPLLVTGIIIAVFAKFVTIPFPKGIGVFAAFSRLFY